MEESLARVWSSLRRALGETYRTKLLIVPRLSLLLSETDPDQINKSVMCLFNPLCLSV